MTHDRRELNRVLGDRCVPKRYHYQGVPKKGGSGGKFVWGKPGDELDMTAPEEQEGYQETQTTVASERERLAEEAEPQEKTTPVGGTQPPKNP